MSTITGTKRSLALTASLALVGTGFVGVLASSPASAIDATGYNAGAYPGLNVCPQNVDGWSSHQSANNQTSWTLIAPANTLISEICVKAGSENQNDGPVGVVFVGPAAEVTFAYPGGKEISHFSYRTTPKPTPTPTETTPPQTTTTPPTTPTPVTVAEAATVAEAPVAEVPVAVPAPATVNVPAAATVPAAVPAGERQDQGAPTWALMFMAAGAIGAAVAGARFMGARN